MLATSLLSLAEHTISEDLLPECPTVLDCGSRGFDFSKAILSIRPRARVIAVEADPDLVELHPGVKVLKIAIVGDPEKIVADYYVFPPPRGECANSIVFSPPSGVIIKRVGCVSISRIMAWTRVDHWDLVKLDIEGSEFDVLDHWPGPIATQITVEFHDYFDPKRWGKEWFERLLAGPLRDYEPVQNEAFSLGGGSAAHWDSLFVLK